MILKRSELKVLGIERENLVRDMRYEIIQNGLCDPVQLGLVLNDLNKLIHIDTLFLFK